MNDTIMRQWQMLRMIPRHPAKISTSEILRRLADEGFETTQRTIQRDLMRLSEIYPLVCDERSKPFGWSWMRDADVFDIPGMDSHTALAFWMAGEHLARVLPPATLRELGPHLRMAGRVLDKLDEGRGAPSWRDKVRVIPRGPKLKSPEIDAEARNAIYEALLRNRRARVCYAPRNGEGVKEYEVNPLGLVLKDGVLYLVCSMWDYPDIRLLVLHRMRGCELLDTPANPPAGFDLDDYIASGELDFALGGEIKLRALFTAEAAFHLAERPLSDDQTLEKQEDGRVLLTATVVDSSELRWWLLGFGEQVEVVGPREMRDAMVRIVREMAACYLP